MFFAMCKLALVACLFCACRGRRVQSSPSAERLAQVASVNESFLQASVGDAPGVLRSLATLLLAFDPVGAFSFSPISLGLRMTATNRLTRSAAATVMDDLNDEPDHMRLETPGALARRAALQLAGTTLGATALPRAASATGDDVGKTLLTSVSKSGRSYGPLLQGPFDFPSASRATVRQELLPGRIWSFEQVQGVIFVHVNVRMTVVKLDSGGLFVYAPIAPTPECLRLLAEIEAEHGDVAHILLPTLALEHKDFAGAFAKARPKAVFWLAPAQYSYPVNLPLTLQGFPATAKLLPPEAKADTVPWASQLPYRTLPPLKQQAGAFQEVVVFDRPSSTLLVTDLVTSLPNNPPDIIAANDLRALLFHARDEPSDAPLDTPEKRMEGWKKICLFGLYFQQSSLVVPVEPDGTFAGAAKFFSTAFPNEPASARALGWGGLFAWRWRPTWPETFEKIRYGGRPFVPPILQEIVLARDTDIVLPFVERVAKDFSFTSIVAAHFDAPVKAGPREWLDAFRPLRATVANYPGALPDADLAFLRDFERVLIQTNTIRARPPRPLSLQP